MDVDVEMESDYDVTELCFWVSAKAEIYPTSGGNVVLFSLYLLPKEGMQGSNFEKIKALST
eukprot:8897745-Pyramimonas_sp.AAC.1